MRLPRLTHVLWRAFPLQSKMENGNSCKHADQFSGSSVLGDRVQLSWEDESFKVSCLHVPLGKSCDTRGWHVSSWGLLFEILGWSLLGPVWMRISILGFYIFSGGELRRARADSLPNQFPFLLARCLDFLSQNPLQSSRSHDQCVANRMQGKWCMFLQLFPQTCTILNNFSVASPAAACGGCSGGAWSPRDWWNHEMEGAWMTE